MSTIINGAKRNQVEELEGLSRNLYENIFNVGLVNNDGKSFYTYVIISVVWYY
jgi:hypothetical protein